MTTRNQRLMKRTPSINFCYEIKGRNLLLTMLDAVYVDAKDEKRIVAIKPKPPFRPILHVATTREGSGVTLLNEPPENIPEARSCFWWRRGRPELHRTKMSFAS
jgi:hypothetical protein